MNPAILLLLLLFLNTCAHTHAHAAQPEVSTSATLQPPALATSHLVRREHLPRPAAAFHE